MISRAETPSRKPAGTSADAPNYEAFVCRVQREAGLSTPGEAALAARATLTTLAERLRLETDEPDVDLLISGLSFQLPEQLREPFVNGHECASRGNTSRKNTVDPTPVEFCLAEFYRRVSRMTGTEPAEAETQARAVAMSLDVSISGVELDRIRSRLPDEFEFLFV